MEYCRVGTSIIPSLGSRDLGITSGVLGRSLATATVDPVFSLSQSRQVQ
jgi:hypothetical protein